MRSALFPGSARALIALVLVALLGSVLVRPVHADTASELRTAEAKLHALEDKIAGESATVSELESQVAALAAQIDKVQSRIAETQIAIIRLQRDIDKASSELLGTQGQLNERARVAYENGPGVGLEFLLSAHSLSDLTSRLEIVNSAAQSDQALIEKLAVQRALLDRKQVRMQVLQTTLRYTQANLKTEEDDLQSKLDAAKNLLDSLNRDRAEADGLVHRLKVKRQQEIEAARLAAALARQRASLSAGATVGPAGSGPQVIGGVLQVCPVDQPHGYSDDFGAPRAAGGFHLHAGNDIFAPAGTPIRAPFPGTASDASNGLGGLAVEVTGGDGFVYNAHLSSVGKLGFVSTGDIVGYVGNTGDAQGGPTHDHFEWHPNSIPRAAGLHVSPYGVSVVNGAIDPFPFLNSVC